MNIAVSQYFYPCSVGKLFIRAFRRLGHNVIGIGPYTDKLPWTEKDVSKYAEHPDVELEWKPQHHIGEALARCSVKPNLIVQVDAGFRLAGKAEGITNIVIATDPHAFPESYYQESFKNADLQYMMQDWYAKSLREVGYPIRWLPYAFDPEYHFWNPNSPKDHIVTLITGLMYGGRIKAKQQLEVALGMNGIFCDNGILFDEGCEIYNRGRIALNWSSRQDLPMRFWEGLAYRNVVLTDRAHDLALLEQSFGIREGTHYLGFDTVEELVEKARWVMDNPEQAEAIATAGYAKVWAGNHTYTARAEQILRDVGVR